MAAKKGKETLKDLSAFLQSEGQGKEEYLEQAAHALVEVERVSSEGSAKPEALLEGLAAVMENLAKGSGSQKRKLFYLLAEKLLAEEQHPNDSMLLNTVYYLQYAEGLEGN